MKYKIELETITRDGMGNVIKKQNHQCNSYVKNFLMLLNAGFKESTSSLIDTGGVARAASAKYCVTYSKWSNYIYPVTGALCGTGGWTPSAAENDDTYGIFVGTSDQAVSTSDYNLISKIAHGDAAGLLHYYATTLPNPTVDGNIVRQRFERTFINNSGAGITVKEIGMVLKTGGDNYMIMIVRDVITPETVVDTGSLDVALVLKTVA